LSSSRNLPQSSWVISSTMRQVHYNNKKLSFFTINVIFTFILLTFQSIDFEILFCIIVTHFKNKRVFIAYQERGNIDPLFAYARKYNLELEIFAHSSNTKHLMMNITKEIVVYRVVFKDWDKSLRENNRVWMAKKDKKSHKYTLNLHWFSIYCFCVKFKVENMLNYRKKIRFFRNYWMYCLLGLVNLLISESWINPPQSNRNNNKKESYLYFCDSVSYH